MPLRYQLLALDIDGTLVDRNEVLTPATADALQRAAGAGVRLVLATGRRYSRTVGLCKPLGLEAPVVTASGALVKDPRDHRTLFRADFDRQLLCRLLGLIDRHGYEPVVCGDTFSVGFDFYLKRMTTTKPELAEYLQLNPHDGRHWPELISNPPPEVFHSFVMGTRDEMLQLEHAIHRDLPGEVQTGVLRSPKYNGFMVELAPAGVTKWAAVCRLADQWGIPHDAICAVGDDVNDLCMIRSAGLGVAMGNAQPVVLSAADRIAPRQDEDGLVQVVEWVLESPAPL